MAHRMPQAQREYGMQSGCAPLRVYFRLERAAGTEAAEGRVANRCGQRCDDGIAINTCTWVTSICRGCSGAVGAVGAVDAVDAAGVRQGCGRGAMGAAVSRNACSGCKSVPARHVPAQFSSRH